MFRVNDSGKLTRVVPVQRRANIWLHPGVHSTLGSWVISVQGPVEECGAGSPTPSSESSYPEWRGALGGEGFLFESTTAQAGTHGTIPQRGRGCAGGRWWALRAPRLPGVTLIEDPPWGLRWSQTMHSGHWFGHKCCIEPGPPVHRVEL